MPAVQSVLVDEHAGQRLDNFLLGQLAGVPRSRVYRMIRSGEVRVNGARCKPHTRLKVDDRVRIPPVRTANKTRVPDPPRRITEMLRESVLFEDANVLVLNKPAGIAVHGGSGEDYGLAEIMARVFETEGLQLAHRLDKATSGCLVATKNRASMLEFHDLFRANTLKKTYLALVEGQWPAEVRTVDARLERFHLPNGERRVRVAATGQRSMTEFSIVSHVTNATWLKVNPHTGRTHQIRVHTQHAGHAVIGDRKYGNRSFQPKSPRLMLHASAIELPEIGPVEAPTPPEFFSYWQALAGAD